jgi:hypothetical protein
MGSESVFQFVRSLASNEVPSSAEPASGAELTAAELGELVELRAAAAAAHAADYRELVEMLASGHLPTDERAGTAILAGAEKTMSDLAGDVEKLSSARLSADRSRERCESMLRAAISDAS